MSKQDVWLKIFPLAEAENAVDAVCQGWDELAYREAPGFQRCTHEPDLTLVLTEYLRDVISPRYGLLGNWGAENVGGKIDPRTLKITERYRTDIQYRWNDEVRSLDIVFEFKKLDHTESSRKYYCGPKGMERFVNGLYSKRQPVALMAAILIDSYSECVPELRNLLQLSSDSDVLRMKPNKNGEMLYMPSKLFPKHAEFDTVHNRPQELGPKHGTIQLSHIFLQFPSNKK